MTILVISELLELEEQYIGLFSKNYILDRSDLIFHFTFEDASGFISEELARKDKHIDFIFINIETADFLDKVDRFANSIRNSDEDYSSQNFQLKSIPIILYKKNFQNAPWETLFENAEFIQRDQKLHSNLFDGIIYKTSKPRPIGLYGNSLAVSID